MKAAVLRLLGRVGLLLPSYRAYERLRTIGTQRASGFDDGLPLPPPELIIRVAGTADAEWFVESGRLAEESIRAALGRAGAPVGEASAILDFGCGCGRVLRRWHGLDASVHGTDLSGPAVEWCRHSLPFAEVATNGLEPPLSYPDGSFDLVYALSVLTHLPVDTQLRWRDELVRILRPGGHLLLTLHGDAYLPRLTPDEQAAYRRGDCVVRWAEMAGSNLCTTFHPPVFVRDRLAYRLELVEHLPGGALGNPEQDLVLLLKPG